MQRVFLAAALLCSTASAAMSQVELSNAPLPKTPMRFYGASSGGMCNACAFIAGSGAIGSDTPAALTRFLTSDDGKEFAHPGAIIYLDSPGGDLKAALELGRLLRKLRFNTTIGYWERAKTNDGPPYLAGQGTCASACVFAFMGGVQRFYDPAPSEGHQASWVTRSIPQSLAVQQFDATTWPSDGSNELADQYISGQLIAYTSEMGVDPGVVAVADATPPNTVTVLTRDDALRLRVTNGVPPPDPWQILPSRGGMVLATQGISNQTPYKAIIACRTRAPGTLSMQVTFPFDMHGIPDPTKTLQESYGGASWYFADYTAARSMDTVVDRLSWSDGSLFANVALLPNHVAVLNAGLTLGLDLNLPYFFHTLPRLSFQVPDFQESSTLLLRNCPG